MLFTSGYSETAIIHHGRLDPGVLLLAKPYRAANLAQMIRKALDGGGSFQAAGDKLAAGREGLGQSAKPEP